MAAEPNGRAEERQERSDRCSRVVGWLRAGEERGGKMRREWTLEGARAVLDDVRARTARAVDETEKLVATRESVSPDERAALDTKIQGVIERWTREMEALGAEVKGVWLVDFDNGSGYYCWRWPETAVDHFHAYDEGFAGRSRIQ
jgi:hypothetical protein